MKVFIRNWKKVFEVKSIRGIPGELREHFRLQIGGEIAKRALLRTVELARMDNGMGGEEA